MKNGRTNSYAIKIYWYFTSQKIIGIRFQFECFLRFIVVIIVRDCCGEKRENVFRVRMFRNVTFFIVDNYFVQKNLKRALHPLAILEEAKYFITKKEQVLKISYPAPLQNG